MYKKQMSIVSFVNKLLGILKKKKNSVQVEYRRAEIPHFPIEKKKKPEHFR